VTAPDDKPPANAGRKQGGRFRPGVSGNPNGKPRGARHRTTRAVQELLDGEAEKLTRKAIELALAGDVQCLRLCIDRLAPVPRRSVSIAFPAVGPFDCADALLACYSAVTAALGAGEIAPGEAVEIISVLDAHRTAIETLKPDAMGAAPTREQLELRRRAAARKIELDRQSEALVERLMNGR
jgi:hypothetical protein